MHQGRMHQFPSAHHIILGPAEDLNRKIRIGASRPVISLKAVTEQKPRLLEGQKAEMFKHQPAAGAERDIGASPTSGRVIFYECLCRNSTHPKVSKIHIFHVSPEQHRKCDFI